MNVPKKCKNIRENVIKKFYTRRTGNLLRTKDKMRFSGLMFHFIPNHFMISGIVHKWLRMKYFLGSKFLTSKFLDSYMTQHFWIAKIAYLVVHKWHQRHGGGVNEFVTIVSKMVAMRRGINITWRHLWTFPKGKKIVQNA